MKLILCCMERDANWGGQALVFAGVLSLKASFGRNK
jgi:hypothetical protein